MKTVLSLRELTVIYLYDGVYLNSWNHNVSVCIQFCEENNRKN